MYKFFNRLIQENQFQEIFSHNLTKKTIKVFLIQCAGILLALIVNFWIARLLNASGYGQFSFIITLITILSSFACLGFSSSIVRDIPVFLSKNSFGEIKGLLRFSFVISFLSAFILFFALAIFMYADLLPLRFEIFTLFNIGISVLASAVLLLRQFVLQGLNHTTQSQIVNSLIRYLVVIFILLIFVNFSSIQIQEVIFINTISLVISFILIEFIVLKAIPEEVKKSQSIYDNKWARTAMVLLAYKLMITYISGSEVLFLGVMREDKEVGIYSIARKISGFVSFGLLAANIVLAPKIASLYQEGKTESLQLLLNKSMRVLFVFSLMVMFVLTIISFPVLKFLGEEYVYSFLPLLIMMFGELINVAFGPVALLLISCNQEKIANKNMFVAIIINVICNLVLIHFFGYIGAAISTSITVVAWNLLMAISVKNKIGIKSGIW